MRTAQDLQEQPTDTAARELLALAGITIDTADRHLLLHVQPPMSARFCWGGNEPSTLVLGRGRIVIGTVSHAPSESPFLVWVASDNGISICDGDPQSPEPVPDTPVFTFPDKATPAEIVEDFAAALLSALEYTGNLRTDEANAVRGGQITQEDEVLELVDGYRHQAVIFRLGTEAEEPEAGYVYPSDTARPDSDDELVAWERGDNFGVSVRDQSGREVGFWWTAHSRAHIRAIARAMLADADGAA